MRKIFLACPYSHSDPQVTEQRFIACNEVAAQIVESGAAVYSQVSMSHPINAALAAKDNNTIGALWGPVDQVFMETMDELIVLDLPGWDASSGIKRELEYFDSHQKPTHLWSAVAHQFVPGR